MFYSSCRLAADAGSLFAARAVTLPASISFHGWQGIFAKNRPVGGGIYAKHGK